MTSNPSESNDDAVLLRELLEEQKIDQTELARRIKTSRVAVNQVLNGKRGITSLMALKLEASLGVSAQRLMQKQSALDLDKAYRENESLIEQIRKENGCGRSDTRTKD